MTNPSNGPPKEKYYDDDAPRTDHKNEERQEIHYPQSSIEIMKKNEKEELEQKPKK